MLQWSYYGPPDFVTLCTRLCHTMLVPDFVTPCDKLCHTLYQTLSPLVPDFMTPYTRPCHTLYQTLPHLVPDFVRPYTKPCHTLYQTLSHLLPNPVIHCTRLCHTLYPPPCHTLYQTLPTPCTAGTPFWRFSMTTSKPVNPSRRPGRSPGLREFHTYISFELTNRRYFNKKQILSCSVSIFSF